MSLLLDALKKAAQEKQNADSVHKETEADAGFDFSNSLKHFLGRQQVDASEFVVVTPVSPCGAGRALLPTLGHVCSRLRYEAGYPPRLTLRLLGASGAAVFLPAGLVGGVPAAPTTLPVPNPWSTVRNVARSSIRVGGFATQ